MQCSSGYSSIWCDVSWWMHDKIWENEETSLPFNECGTKIGMNPELVAEYDETNHLVVFLSRCSIHRAVCYLVSIVCVCSETFCCEYSQWLSVAFFPATFFFFSQDEHKMRHIHTNLMRRFPSNPIRTLDITRRQCARLPFSWATAFITHRFTGIQFTASIGIWLMNMNYDYDTRNDFDKPIFLIDGIFDTNTFSTWKRPTLLVRCTCRRAEAARSNEPHHKMEKS